MKELVIAAAYVTVFTTVLSYLWLYRSLGKALAAFAWFIFFSGAIQFVSLVCWLRHMNNLPLLHIYVAGGFLCLAWFYCIVLGSYIHRFVIWGSAIVCVLFSVINTLFIQPVYIFNSYALVVESVFVIILSLFTFLFLLNQTIQDSGIRDMSSINWINSGLFIYYLSSLLIYYFSNNTIFSTTFAMRRYTWMFHAFFSVVMYSCFLIGLWKRSKTRD